MSEAIESQGTVFYIGQGDAASVSDAADTFDAVGEVKTTEGPNGSASIIDVSHLGSTRVEKLMGLPDEGQLPVTFNRIFDDVGQVSMRAARADREKRNFRVAYPNGTVGKCQGFVLEFSTTTGVNQAIEGRSAIEITGEYTEV